MRLLHDVRASPVCQRSSYTLYIILCTLYGTASVCLIRYVSYLNYSALHFLFYTSYVIIHCSALYSTRSNSGGPPASASSRAAATTKSPPALGRSRTNWATRSVRHPSRNARAPRPSCRAVPSSPRHSRVARRRVWQIVRFFARFRDDSARPTPRARWTPLGRCRVLLGLVSVG